MKRLSFNLLNFALGWIRFGKDWLVKFTSRPFRFRFARLHCFEHQKVLPLKKQRNLHPILLCCVAETEEAFVLRVVLLPFRLFPTLSTRYSSGSTGPKDVVIVIDVSGSMQTAGRYVKAKQAAKALIDTLEWKETHWRRFFCDGLQLN